jgi:hypothetical protein
MASFKRRHGVFPDLPNFPIKSIRMKILNWKFKKEICDVKWLKAEIEDNHRVKLKNIQCSVMKLILTWIKILHVLPIYLAFHYLKELLFWKAVITVPYTLKTKTRKKNQFRSSTVMVLKMFFFWNKKCSLFEKHVLFSGTKS